MAIAHDLSTRNALLRLLRAYVIAIKLLPAGGWTGLQMLLYSLVIFVIAVIGALFGFLCVTADVPGGATLLFFIFESLFVISLLTSVGRRGG